VLSVVGWTGLTVWSLRSTAAGVLSLIVLAMALSRYWAPSTVRIDAAGVHVRHLGWTRHHSWDRFHRVRCDDHGLFLGPGPRESRLDAFRGLFLRCAEEERERACALARSHVTT